jgi:hypothetical protein
MKKSSGLSRLDKSAVRLAGSAAVGSGYSESEISFLFDDGSYNHVPIVR